VSINRPQLFAGENYPLWKVRMQIFLESVDTGIWDAVINGLFVPVNLVHDMQEPNPLSQWTADENRQAQYDVKARHTISSTLTLDEFYKISICTSACGM